MKVIKPPQDFFKDVDHLDRPDVAFLAGSIEMGNAPNWQQNVEEALSHKDGILLNPRRDAWDDSWEQSIDNPDFKHQVEWELMGLETADVIMFYFAPGTKCPITLLELGLHANGFQELLVCCPEGFWRKGNVDIICEQYDIRNFDTLEETIDALENELL